MRGTRVGGGERGGGGGEIPRAPPRRERPRVSAAVIRPGPPRRLRRKPRATRQKKLASVYGRHDAHDASTRSGCTAKASAAKRPLPRHGRRRGEFGKFGNLRAPSVCASALWPFDAPVAAQRAVRRSAASASRHRRSALTLLSVDQSPARTTRFAHASIRAARRRARRSLSDASRIVEGSSAILTRFATGSYTPTTPQDPGDAVGGKHECWWSRSLRTKFTPSS